MDPRCERCGGACCESITLSVRMGSDDLQRFVELRTKPVLTADGIERNFNVPCSLLVAGRCVGYEIRPQVCRDFLPGSEKCQVTVRARRPPELVEAILALDV